MSTQSEPSVSFGLAPSRRPAAAPGSLAVAAVVVPVIIAVIFVAIRDILVRGDLISGEEWIPVIFDWMADVPWKWWAVPAGIAVSIIGVLLVVVACLPRRRTHIRMRPAEHDIWTRRVDFCRMCSATAEMVPGIMDAHTTYTARRVVINARGGGASIAELRSRVEKVVHPLVDVLAEAPEVKVHVTLLGQDPRLLHDQRFGDVQKGGRK